MGWQCFPTLQKTFGIRTKYGALLSSMARKSLPGNSINSEKFPQRCFDQIQSPKAASLWHGGRGCGTREYEKTLFFMRHKLGNIQEAPCGLEGNSLFFRRNIKKLTQQVGNRSKEESQLNRDYFVQIWVSDKKMNELDGKRRRKLGKRNNLGGISYVDQMPLQHLAERWFSGDTSIREKSDPSRRVLQQPPPSQSVSGLLEPTSPEEVRSNNPYSVISFMWSSHVIFQPFVPEALYYAYPSNFSLTTGSHFTCMHVLTGILNKNNLIALL